MRKFSADTLEDVLIKAAEGLECSVIDLEYEIIQQPSNGFFGIGKREAVIIADKKTQNTFAKKIKKHTDFVSMEEHCLLLEEELKELLGYMPYALDIIRVSPYDNQTISIFIDGADSALLIGEKGYRYKALSYLLFNWIQPKYGYNIRLEIAQFLQMQEEIIEEYLQNIQEDIKNSQSFRTKNLGGVLSIIALKRLRELYPGRYVCLKQDGNEQYILISSVE